MFECDMLTPTIRFYGEVTCEKAVNLRNWRGNTHHLTSIELKGDTIEYVVQAGTGENAHQVTLHGTVPGTRAFRRATLKALTKLLQTHENRGMPLCWVTGDDAHYTFTGYVTVGALTYLAMYMKDLP